MSSSDKKRKSAKKKPKKSKQELEEERKKREAERARRDAERAKKRLELRAKIAENKETKTKKKESATKESTEETEKEQRKKILRYRRAQSRFALPKINPNDDLEAIAKANAELEAALSGSENNDDNDNDNDNDDNKEKEEITQKKVEVTIDNVQEIDDEEIDDEEKKNDFNDTQSVSSFQSVEELALSPEQEDALSKLENDLESADPDYYGFVDYTTFMSILKQNDIKLSAKHETFLMGGLTLIDEGVDYYDFVRKIRETGRELQPDNTLQDICEEISETVEKQQSKDHQPLPSTNLEDIASEDIANVDESEFEAFFQKAQAYGRGRGQSLARMKSASAEVDKGTKLGELIDDLALDGADVDFALLKMSLSTIDCNPNDKDLKYLINHLCEDDTGFVDFNYLITFLQETSGVPTKKWTRLEKIISKVVNQLKMVERAEQRKKAQELKLKQRLEKKRNTRLANSKKGDNDELAKLQAEEKRLRALRLRDKAKQVKK